MSILLGILLVVLCIVWLCALTGINRLDESEPQTRRARESAVAKTTAPADWVPASRRVPRNGPSPATRPAAPWLVLSRARRGAGRREGRPTRTTCPDPRTSATEAAVKAANDAVHDAALYVADEFDRLVHLRDGRLTATLRDRLAALSAAFDVEAAAYAARDAASEAEWEAQKRMADARDRVRAALRASDVRAPTVSEQTHRFGS